MQLTPAVAEYLIQIYLLQREGDAVVGARLAERMGVTPPAVTQALQRIARDGLVTMNRGTGVQLTEQGRGLAESTIRRHYLIERLLVDVLGLGWTEVHEEANRLEHALSAELEQRLYLRLGRPTTCPHGNPFPGSPEERALLFAPPLAEAQEGMEVTVLRITEEAEEDDELMHYLWDHQVVPGARFKVVKKDPQAHALTLGTPERTFPLPLAYAQKVRMSPPASV